MGVGNPKAEFRNPKEIRMMNYRNPKHSSQEGMQGKDEIEIGALPIGQDNEE